MSPVLPVGVSLSHELDIGLVHKGSGLQGVIWPFMAQMAGRQPMKLLVNDRNELAGGFLIAVCELAQQRGSAGRDGLHSVPPQALRARRGFYSHWCCIAVVARLFLVRLVGFAG